MRTVARVGLSLVLSAVSTYAQEATPAASPAASPAPDSKHSGAPLGQFTIGSVVVTPTFRIGTFAVDTNVQYLREKRTDFLAAAGPGLDFALPFLDHWQLDIQGSSQYFYFYRTKELRRWTGAGTASLHWATTGTRASLSTGLTREFSRPSFEVDARVASKRAHVLGSIERDLGRLTLALRTSLEATKVDQGQEFRGADLAATLTTDRYRGDLDLFYHLTPLTSIVFEGGYEETHFPNEVIRNFAQENAGAGFVTSGLLKGRVTAGVRRTHLLLGRASNTQPYLRGDLSQHLGQRFVLSERYDDDSTISAFTVNGSLPTFERRTLGVELTILITKRIDMKLKGTRESLRGNGLVQVVLDDGTTAVGKRDDLIYTAEADVGMRLGRTGSETLSQTFPISR